MYLTPDQILFFNENGYLVIENFWTLEIVKKLKTKIIKVIEDLSVNEDSDNTSVFTTTEQIRKTDKYFLESGDKIRFFWEPKARKEDGSFSQRPQDCINKIGHALHDLDPDFQQVSYEERVGKICRDLGFEVPLAVQSMYIFKQANIGGEVGVHQDGTFLYTEPQSVLGFWWSLDDCYKTNGCLWAVPGSHKHVVTRRCKL
jgi:phytanoyl-CoA hydroxylase